MATSQIFVDRPGLERILDAGDFADPVRAVADDHRYLRRVLERLAALADYRHLTGRRALAASLRDYLSRDLTWIIDDEDALIALLEEKHGIGRTLRTLAAEVRAEHRMVRRLLPPVLHRLRQIEARGLPDDPSVFVVATFVLCEFLRMHAECEDATLLPLASMALAPADFGDLAIDMALRRGLSA